MTTNSPLLSYDILSEIASHLSDVRNLEETSQEVCSTLRKYPDVIPEIYRRSLDLLRENFPDVYHLIPARYNTNQKIKFFYAHLRDIQRTQITFEKYGNKIVSPRALRHDVGDDVGEFISDEANLRELRVFNQNYPEIVSITLDAVILFLALAICFGMIPVFSETLVQEPDSSFIDLANQQCLNLGQFFSKLSVATPIYSAMHVIWSYPKIGLRAFKVNIKEGFKQSSAMTKINKLADRALNYISGYCPFRFC